jgi:hypothetical protein
MLFNHFTSLVRLIFTQNLIGIRNFIAILTNYENSVPPNFPQQTQITSFIYVENTLSVDEKNMVFSLTLDMSSIWLDARLAYADSVTPKKSLDITSDEGKIWKPQIQVTDNVKDEGK